MVQIKLNNRSQFDRKNDMLYFRHIAASFSTTGLILGLAFFYISLTPSLLPRDHFVQGILSGVVFATGYGIGRLGHWIWQFMELARLMETYPDLVVWELPALEIFSPEVPLDRFGAFFAAVPPPAISVVGVARQGAAGGWFRALDRRSH